MPFTKLLPTSIDLAQNFAFTGSVTGAGGGKVNQIITMNTSSQTQITGSSFTDTTITASITPSATNSKILIQITDSNMFTHTNSHDDNGMGFRIKRTIGGSAATLVTDNNTYEGFYSSQRSGSNHNRRQHLTWHYVDTTHNTTSAITYMHQIALYRGNDNANGKSVHDNNRGNMTLIEVLA
jgi:hypothetical protein